MRWKGQQRSTNIEDRRGSSPTYARSGGGAGGLLLLFRFLPLILRSKTGRVVLIIGAVLFFSAQFFGVDFLSLLSGQPAASNNRENYQPSEAERELADFVAVVLGDTETTWQQQFQRMGQVYQEPTLVMYSGYVNSACGMGQAAMGPFYCPNDGKVYIDLSFYRDLKLQHHAPGDFAQAYVIAHEVGHHVQNLLGIANQVHNLQQRVNKADANALSVRMELQADCYAGLWAHNANVYRQLLEQGDLEEALTAATAIGDDRLQRQAQGYVVPESFTHGTSEQRARWFAMGFKSGDMNACDTFSSNQI